MPQLRMRDASGTLRTISRIRMRDAGGVLRTIQQIRMRDAGGVLRLVFQYLSVALSTYYAFATNSGAASSGTTTTASVTSTVIGGTGPFTYLWEYVSGDLGITITTPTGANTTFSATVVASVNKVALFRLRVTDANGAVSYSPNLTVELEWVDTR